MTLANHRPATSLGSVTAITCALALVAAMLLAACAEGGGLAVRATDHVQRSLDVAPGTPVRVESFNGGIEVTAAAGTTVSAEVDRTGEGRTRAEAEADRDHIAVTLDLVDGTAVLRAVYEPSPSSVRGGRGASVMMRVPPATTLELVTSNGGVSVRDSAAAVDAQSSNGPVTLQGVSGTLSVVTSNAPITVEAGSATAHLRTSNAALRFTGSLQAGSHVFETSNGPLELRLPSDASFNVEATTSNASISSDFAVAGEMTREMLRGTVGEAEAASAVTVAARTSNAGVTLRGT